jgi:hypothetical protein
LKPLIELLVDGANKAYVTDRDWYEELEYGSEGTANFAVLEEIVLSDHWGFRFEVNHYMYDAFNRKIVQLVESGLADVLVKNATKKWRKVEAEEEHVALTIDHLAVWFYLWLILLGIALLAFIVEVCRVKKVFDCFALKVRSCLKKCVR